MKKSIAFVLCLFMAVLSAKAQNVSSSADNKAQSDSVLMQLSQRGITLRMSYDDYKSLYDPRSYVPEPFDPYSTVGTGIASFFIPGLGQMINGEAGRGAGMLAGSLGCVLAGILIPCLWTTTDSQGNTKIANGAFACTGVCFAGSLAIDIWSICDAVRMAKIKNLYYRDCKSLSSAGIDMKLSPSLAVLPVGQSLSPAPGLTLAVTF